MERVPARGVENVGGFEDRGPSPYFFFECDLVSVIVSHTKVRRKASRNAIIDSDLLRLLPKESTWFQDVMAGHSLCLRSTGDDSQRACPLPNLIAYDCTDVTPAYFVRIVQAMSESLVPGTG